MPSTKLLNIVSWNCNGILRNDTPGLIAEVMIKHDIDVFLVSETHIRSGAVEDLSALDQFEMYPKSRGGVDKRGGGLLTLVKKGLNHMRHVPAAVMFQYLDNEREWLLLHENGANVAVCMVYMAAEVVGAEFQAWNGDLISMIQAELVTLREQGYSCVLMGDFNGHIGCDSQGVGGNLPDVNHNGRLVRDFCARNDLCIVNADKSRCSGIFTRVVSNSVSLLDLVIEEATPGGVVHSMVVDEFNNLLGGSDHSALIVTLQLGAVQTEDTARREEYIPSPSEANSELFRTKLSDLMGQVDWKALGTDDKYAAIVKVLTDASKLCGSLSTPPRKVPVACKSIARLRARCMAVDSKVRRLRTVETVYGFEDSVAGQAMAAELAEAIRVSTELRMKLGDKVQTRRKVRRFRLRARKSMSSKQFWKLVRKVVKKAGCLSAIKDLEGVLATDRDKIEEIVLSELAKIFSGQKSRIFTHRNAQLIKEAAKTSAGGWEEWISDSVDPLKYEDRVCRPVGEAEIGRIVNGLKRHRAPGVDGVTPMMLKCAGPVLLNQLTELFNAILGEGCVPEALAVGKMTLIDKKSPSLNVSDKRPLTVSSVILSVFTKVLHGRLDMICEEEDYYGEVQYGFRSGRSTTDCIFMLLAAVRRAKRNHQVISVAFCDIAKAYDSVDRELLYRKLDSLGFGGRIKSIVQSMYFNDCVRVRIKGGLSAPLWFTKGVKQGCVLSPLLFALYISGLGKVLHALREGVHFDNCVISALFFADDLILISRTRLKGMERMFKVVQRFCSAMSMKLAVSKTVILSNGPAQTAWTVDDDEPGLEAVLVGKYLGIDLQVKGRNLLRPGSLR